MMDLISKIVRKFPIMRKHVENFSLYIWPHLTSVLNFRRVSEILFYIRRGHLIRRHIIKKYFHEATSPKLQVGCGPKHLLSWWLNGDIVGGDIYLDARKKMPFKDNSFDYVFSEEMLEHLTLSEGKYFLSECYRILKDKGVIRISTPDLGKLIQCYQNTNPMIDMETLLIKSYHNRELSRCEMFNSAMRQEGEFIYDKDFMITILKKAKFRNIIFCERQKSTHKPLSHIEVSDVRINLLRKAMCLIVEAQKD